MRRETPGYFGIGIYNPKRQVNVGTLWRSAASLGASFTFQIGSRYERQASDTCVAYRLLPHYEYATPDEFFANIPRACVPVAVELDDRSVPLETFAHPASAVYLLGAEDSGIPASVMDRCASVVQLPGEFCLNVAATRTVVIYDRVAKPQRVVVRSAA